MDCTARTFTSNLIFKLTSIFLLFVMTLAPAYARVGYFQLHNLMSQAQKNLASNLFFNDTRLNLQNRERTTGRVVNTQFANDGGMAGCGVTSTLMQYMYQNSGTVDISKNYIALNVYSQIPGFDPGAPFWGNPEGALKGYLTQSTPNNIAYPYTPYHRVIPSIYPAYLGSYNNGLNCGRYVEADFDTQSCNDRTTPAGISKFCPLATGLTYGGLKLQGYVFDSCEDNNGWCRDDAAHIDVNFSAFPTPANYYLQWKFIRNPYYSDPKAPASLKDIWLAWFSQPSPYWSYIALLNLENGISNVQYNIGDAGANPAWIDSHVLAGDNNVTWSSTSNNGQLWQIEPLGSLTDAAPATNPSYQMRIFDYLGYPANHGVIYQFKLLFDDGTLGQSVAGYYFFYQGGARVKAGAQAQNMTLITPPMGQGVATISFGQLLPSNVSLDASKTNYLRPVLISDGGYAYDPSSCTTNQCSYTQLPTSATFHLFAHAIDDVSNDFTMRKVNDIAINSADINFSNGSTTLAYTLQTTDINLSTLYSARVIVPVAFATNNTTPINGNLQALFVPDVAKNNLHHITAQTQGCFLNTYINNVASSKNKKDQKHYFGNNTICTVYYTINQQTSFSSSGQPPAAYFNLILPKKVGFNPVNYALTVPYQAAIQVAGYNPVDSALPTPVTAPLANYASATDAARSLYLLLDPQSDANCLKNLDPNLGVAVTLGSSPAVKLTQADLPLETQISAVINATTFNVNLVSGTKNLVCVAMPSIPTNTAAGLTPGIDVVDVIKLVAQPTIIPKPVNQGILATASGDAACLGAIDNLSFVTNNVPAATVAYTVSQVPTNVGVSVSAGTYTITDKAFQVIGGTCQLNTTPTINIQTNVFTPITLNYKFTQTSTSTCTATPTVSSWTTGCNVQFTLTSTTPLNNVVIFWQKGLYDWTRAAVWGGEGSLAIPSDPTGNVTWALPTWVNGQGSIVGMTINVDGVPSLCTGFNSTKGGIVVGCSGVPK